MKRGVWILIIITILIISIFIIKSNLTGFALSNPKYDLILFLGDSITQDGRYVNLVKEAFSDYTIINKGLSRETVSGLTEEGISARPYLFDRLKSILDTTHPDIIFACYGMNDGIYLPFDESRFEKFKEGITKLNDKVQERKIKIIFLTPPPFDKSKINSELSFDYDDTLQIYSDWLLSKRAEGWNVIDIRSPLIDSDIEHTDDGIHPNNLGHELIANEIIKYLNKKI